MTPTATLCLPDDVRIVVPDSLELLTPYVLREQQDWFEDEIKCLRRLLEPGQQAIDIGANYGVYALSMARTVGPTGRVWAFEPGSHSAGFLAESIAANGFTHVALERSGVSNREGVGRLSLGRHAEMNALVDGAPRAGATETVPLVTLDGSLERLGWRDIDFVKIDAEGEEANIVEGGSRFLAELSPLVQYEIRVGSKLQLELVEQFASIGYESYRLVPGLDLLVPFDAASKPDAHLLNLFCCKADRAAMLSARGLLLERVTSSFTTLFARVRESDAYGWRKALATVPYGTALEKAWERTMALGRSSLVEEALSFHAASQDASLTPPERFGALKVSFNLLKTACDRQPAFLRLASLARVARNYGARSLAVLALAQLSVDIVRAGADPSEPFLAPGERFDTVPASGSVAGWTRAAVLEELERLIAPSSFYTGASARERLETIHTLGYGSEEMARRLRLVQARAAAAASR